jgi:hypothetical protein
VVHGPIEVVEVFVSQDIVIDDVPLSPRVGEGIVITISREIEPLERL